MALRALLTDAREAAGLTQEQLARRLNKPQSYVWKLENGERVLAYAEAPAYARAVGLKFSEFSLRYAAQLRQDFQKWLDAAPRHRAAFVRLEFAWYTSDQFRLLRPTDGSVDDDLIAKL